MIGTYQHLIEKQYERRQRKKCWKEIALTIKYFLKPPTVNKKSVKIDRQIILSATSLEHCFCATVKPPPQQIDRCWLYNVYGTIIVNERILNKDSKKRFKVKSTISSHYYMNGNLLSATLNLMYSKRHDYWSLSTKSRHTQSMA